MQSDQNARAHPIDDELEQSASCHYSRDKTSTGHPPNEDDLDPGSVHGPAKAQEAVFFLFLVAQKKILQNPLIMRCFALITSLFLLACNGPNASEKNISSAPSGDKQIDLPDHHVGPDSIQDNANGGNVKKQMTSNQKTSDGLPTLTQDNVIPLLTEYGKNHPQNRVLISTQFGKIKIKLFEETPLHRANFLYLIQQEYFTNTFFHRIVPNFIIQGGNSDLRSTPKKRKLLGPKYRIPAEINPNRKHTYGTLSGAKEYRENPDKLSAPYEFFIFCGPDVSGRHLNGNYTIFGEVIQGMDVVETIANLPADQGEWPKSNVYIELSVDQ